MLSEDLQHGIGRNQTSEPRVPHRSEVFTGVLFQLDGEAVFTGPLNVAIGGKTSSQSLRIRAGT